MELGVYNVSVFLFDSLSRLLLYSVNQENQQLRIIENYLFECDSVLHGISLQDILLVLVLPCDYYNSLFFEFSFTQPEQ